MYYYRDIVEIWLNYTTEIGIPGLKSPECAYTVHVKLQLVVYKSA